MESVQEAVASTSVSAHQGREGLAALRILRHLDLGKDGKGSTSFKNCAAFIFAHSIMNSQQKEHVDWKLQNWSWLPVPPLSNIL